MQALFAVLSTHHEVFACLPVFLVLKIDVICAYTITKNPRRCFPSLCYLKTIFNFKTLFRFRQGVCEILGLSFPLLYFVIQERTRLTYFDYGDIICREGEMPQGIFLIISGMASVRATTFSSFKCILNIQL